MASSITHLPPLPPTKHLTLYIDTSSPFAHLAYHTLRHAPIFSHQHNPSFALTYTPVLLRAIIATTGNKPPLAVKNKGEYTIRDLHRWAKRFSIPILSEEEGPVEGFPLDTLCVMRCVLALRSVCPSAGEADVVLGLVDRLYEELWVKRVDVTKKEVLLKVMTEYFASVNSSDKGVEIKHTAEEILHMAETSVDLKAQLTANTNDALNNGAFGLPYFVARNDETGETDKFFGFDHLAQVVEFLGLEWPAGGEEGEKNGEGWKKGFRAFL